MVSKWESLVEAHLVSIDLSEPSLLRVGLVDTLGRKWEVTAVGVYRLMVTELREQNIVDQIVLFPDIATLPAGPSQRLSSIMGKSERGDTKTQPSNTRLDELKNKELQYLEIEAVYGAEVFVVAQGITLEHLSPV